MKTVLGSLQTFLDSTNKTIKLLNEVSAMADPASELKRVNLIARLQSEKNELTEAISVLVAHVALSNITKEVIDGKQGNAPST